MKIDMEYKKGVLFIRLKGIFNRVNALKFDEEVLPVVLRHGIRYVVLNLDEIETIDTSGIESLINLSDIVSKWDGKTSFCNLNNNIKSMIENSKVYSCYYESKDELSALGLFRI